MLKQLDAKMEAAIRIAALEKFTEDFDCLGDLVADTFDTVQVELEFMAGAGSPTDEIYEATRKPLAAVKLMIATGNEPVDEVHTGFKSKLISEQIRINRYIRDMANAYLDRAESEFADRMLEIVLAIKATVIQPERIQKIQKIETVETRIAASLTNPVWSGFLLEIKYAPIGMKKLGFQLVALGEEHRHCPDCSHTIEGYQLKAEKFTYIRWRCTNPGCVKSGTIQSEQVAL